jgi:hypothetical protein
MILKEKYKEVVRVRRGRRHKQLLYDLKKYKEEALAHTMWRTRFRRGYGTVVRQTTERTCQ